MNKQEYIEFLKRMAIEARDRAKNETLDFLQGMEIGYAGAFELVSQFLENSVEVK